MAQNNELASLPADVSVTTVDKYGPTTWSTAMSRQDWQTDREACLVRVGRLLDSLFNNP
jgi:hypothetical protein